MGCCASYRTVGIDSVTLKKLVKPPKKSSKAVIAGIGLQLRDGLIYAGEGSKLGAAMLAAEKQYGLVARLLLKYSAQIDVRAVGGLRWWTCMGTAGVRARST